MAYWFKDHYGIKIVSNQRAKNFGVPKWKLGDIKRDVHLIEDLNYPKIGTWQHGKRVFHGAMAVARLLSIKHPFVWTIYNFKPTGFLFNLLYFAIKKTRKYLHFVF